MKSLKVVLCVLMIFACFLPAFSQNGSYELQQAKKYMNQGSYQQALQFFNRVAQDSYNDEMVRREAKYYVGFCFVKIGDLWRAIDAYKSFLERYDNGNSMLVPDALYVLGRTYENVGEISSARRVYRRCVDQFPGNKFANNSRNRLNIIGGGNTGHSGNYNNSNTVSYEIRDLIEWAKDAEYYSEADKILRRGLNKARNGADLAALSKAFYDESRQKSFLQEAVTTSIFRRINVRDVVRLAETAQYYSARDLVLAAGIRNVIDGREFVLLSQPFDDATKQKSFLKDVVAKDIFRRMNAQDMVTLADSAQYDSACDWVLAAGMRSIRDGRDFIYLARAFKDESRQKEAFLDLKSGSVFRVMRINEVIDLAHTAYYNSARDALLIEAARRIARSARDFRALANATDDYQTEREINQIGMDKLDSYDNYLSARSDGEIKIEKKTAKEQNQKIENSANDPYQDLKIDRAKYNRIAKFIKAVNSKKGMNKALKTLKKSDLSIPTVKSYMKKYRSLQKFEKLHNK